MAACDRVIANSVTEEALRAQARAFVTEMDGWEAAGRLAFQERWERIVNEPCPLVEKGLSSDESL